MNSHHVTVASADDESLISEANQLLKCLVDELHPKFGIGTFAPSVYDTAWVAMVTRSIDGVPKIIFPGSVACIVSTQLPDGSFPGDGSDIDLISNTMASLLCFSTIRSKGVESNFDLDTRISNATTFLAKKLQTWDVYTTERIAFEITIPRMLELLSEMGICFSFPQYKVLMKIRAQKLAKLGNLNKMLRFKSTLVHSLEAFIGLADLSPLRGLKTAGSMMCSPSSTAAYLMSLAAGTLTNNNEVKWDEEAEEFLRFLTGKSGGWVPNCTPTTVFEYSWSVCNLLQNGFERSSLNQENLSWISERLEEIMKVQNGVSGWAPDAVPDADDSSKATVALSLLGAPINVQKIIDKFEDKTHFRCFEIERNLSLSANCNVLLALLENVQGVERYKPEIEKILTLLCETWWGGGCKLLDKWHCSPYYLQMLVSQAITKYLFRIHSQGNLAKEDKIPTVTSLRIPLLLFQLALSIISTQNSDGSWGIGAGREETSYAIIALANLASHNLTTLLHTRINSTIIKGRAFLVRTGATERWKVQGENGDFIWIGKVGYAVETVCKSYVLGAAKVPVPAVQFRYEHEHLLEGEKRREERMEKIKRSASFFSRLPVFKDVEKEVLKIWMMESFLVLPELKAHRFNIFDRKGMEDDAKYLNFIPFSWTAADRLVGSELSNAVLFAMSEISMFNFQADEYIDGLAIHSRNIRNGNLDEEIGGRLRRIVNEIFADLDSQESEKNHVGSNGLSDGHKRSYSDSNMQEDATLRSDKSRQHKQVKTENGISSQEDPHIPTSNTGSEIKAQIKTVYTTLRRFTTSILSHPHIQRSSTRDRKFLKRELHSYLLAQAGQCEDNRRFQAQPESTKTEFTHPPSSYVKWVRTLGAETTSAVFSFAFFICLLGHEVNSNPALRGGREVNGEEDVFRTPMERYLAEAVMMHNGAGVRLWNDYGSLARDEQEGNVNSVLFPEFASTDIRAGDTVAVGNDTCTSADSTTYDAGVEMQKTNPDVANGLTEEQARMKAMGIEKKKQNLVLMAQHEYTCLGIALSELEGICCSEGESQGNLKRGLYVVRALKLFCTTSRVYNEMYAARDVSARHV